jgi:hypothetical protein
MKRHVLALALLLVPTLARAQMPSLAFMTEARIGGGAGVIGGGGGGASASLTFGARLADRLQVGVGFGLFRYSTPGVNIGPNNINNDTTTFTLNPTVAVDILKAKDNKVAWYGKIALPLGARVTPNANNPNTNNTVFVIGYDLGLGARYCPHPNFAFGAEAGLTGLFIDPSGNTGSGTTAVYGAVVGTFYWGKST